MRILVVLMLLMLLLWLARVSGSEYSSFVFRLFLVLLELPGENIGGVDVVVDACARACQSVRIGIFVFLVF